MAILYFILALFATICFVVAISNVPNVRINWIALGLAFIATAWTIQYAQLVF